MPKKKPPKFEKKKSKVVPKVSVDFEEMGISLSDQLPTYDVPMDLIVPNEWNINEMDDPTFNRLVQEIEETGFIAAIQIIPSEGGKFKIIGGENRWHAVRTLGWDTIPCHVFTDGPLVDPKLKKLISVRLNVIKGETNPGKFTKLYEEMVEEYGAEQLQALFGYTQTDAWQKLTKDLDKSLQEAGVGGEALRKELKKRTKKIKTVDGLGTVLQSLFRKHGNDLQHGFMVFSFGNRNHVYVVATEWTMDVLDEAMGFCREKEMDLNDLLAPALEKIVKDLKKKNGKKRKQ